MEQYSRLFLDKWYSNLFGMIMDIQLELYVHGMIKWNHSYSSKFHITCGTGQGSIIYPRLFNIFIKVFLIELNNTDCGIWIDHSRKS